jgi:hypothetical protein
MRRAAERERLHGRAVQPLRVIDEAHERLVGGGLREQAEDGQADQEVRRRLALVHAEDDRERVTLLAGQSLDPVGHRPAQLMQPGVGELHLGLDTRRARDRAPRCPLGKVVEQRCLADPRLAVQDEHGALARAHVGEQPVETFKLTATAE